MSHAVENLSFDTRLYSTGRGLHGDAVALSLEHQIAPEAERINPYILRFDSSGEPIDFTPRWQTARDFLENEGLYGMRDMAGSGVECMLWISPASTKERLPESRVVVGLAKGTGVNGLEIECRALCLEENEEYCLNLAERLGIKAADGDELRAKAIKVELNGEDWINRLEKLIEKKQIWEAVRKGRDVSLKADREKIMTEVLSRTEHAAKQMIARGDHIGAGALIEREIMSMGIKLSSRGDCGSLNTAMMKPAGTFGIGAFDQIFNRSQIKEAHFDCPRCHGPIPSGKGIETCPHCGMTKQEAGSVCD